MRLGKMVLGGLAAVVLTAVVVTAVIITSSQVERTQNVFTALELIVSPDPFPDLIAGLGPPLEQIVIINVTNPSGGPALTGLVINVTLVAVAGCALGSVTETTATGQDLCLGVASITANGGLLAVDESFEIQIVIQYQTTFVGTAVFTFEAEGVTV